MTDTVRVLAAKLRMRSLARLSLKKPSRTDKEDAKLDIEAADALERQAAMLAASPQGEGSSADAPVEAVAWRFWHEGGWNFSITDPSPHLADCVERDALYTHPAPIKPSGDTGELRERVAQIIEAAIERHNPGNSLRHTIDDADAILALIQSERGGA